MDDTYGLNQLFLIILGGETPRYSADWAILALSPRAHIFTFGQRKGFEIVDNIKE